MSGSFSSINSLYESFDQLELAISTARANLVMRESLPLDLLAKLAEYEEMLILQRKLADVMCEQIRSEKWEEVSTSIKRINGISQRIYHDTEKIIRSTSEDEEILQVMNQDRDAA